MASTIIVLVTPLIVGVGHLIVWLVTLVATSRLAKRNGQKIKSMSKSLVHGFQVEFFEKDSET